MAEPNVLFRVDPIRTPGPMAPDAMTDHEHVTRERKEEATGFWRRNMQQFLFGEPMDMNVPIQSVSILKMFDRVDGEGKPRHVGKRISDSYKLGKEMYRRLDRTVAALFAYRGDKELDALTAGAIDLNADKGRAGRDEQGTTERMGYGGQSMAGARGPGFRVHVNLQDTANQLAGPKAPKLLRGPREGEIEGPLARRALPAPPRQLTDQRDTAQKGRDAARKAQEDKSDPKAAGKGDIIEGTSVRLDGTAKPEKKNDKDARGTQAPRKKRRGRDDDAR